MSSRFLFDHELGSTVGRSRVLECAYRGDKDKVSNPSLSRGLNQTLRPLDAEASHFVERSRLHVPGGMKHACDRVRAEEVLHFSGRHVERPSNVAGSLRLAHKA